MGFSILYINIFLIITCILLFATVQTFEIDQTEWLAAPSSMTEKI